jgi:CHAP domain
MAITRYSGFGLLGAAALVGLSAASCSSAPATYDQGSDEPNVGTTQEAVTGAVGDWTGFIDGQCVAGVFHFFETRFGASFVGLCAQGANVGNCENCGACMIWNGSRTEPNPAVWNRYAWGSVMPQLYDMVVYPPSGAALGYGHVAAVDHMNGSNPAAYGSMYVMDSNWYGNQKMATAVHTVPRVPYGIYRLKSLAGTVNEAPRGYIDAATCSSVGGWAQDPSVATAAINADLYFNGPAGTAGAPAIRLTADQARPDLCAPLGSCNHAWSMPTPRGAMDGKAHPVFAYGIDSAGGPNTLLAGSPLTFTCAAPPIAPTSVKRAIPSMDLVNAWSLSTFFDMATYTDAEVDAIGNGPAFDHVPLLEKATGTADVFVIDGTQRRHVTGEASFAAWRFTSAMVKAVAPADLAALPAGLDWPATPLLVKGESATVYLLDATTAATPPAAGGAGTSPAKADPGGTGTGAGTGNVDGTAPADGSSAGGCSVARAPDRRADGLLWLFALVAGTALFVTRRSARRPRDR